MIRGVLIDLSGTVHVSGSDTLIVEDGVVEAIQRLRKDPNIHQIKFCTNTSKLSLARLLEQFNNTPSNTKTKNTLQQLQITREELLTSVIVTKQYIQKHKLKPYYIVEDTTDLVDDNTTTTTTTNTNLHYSQIQEDDYNCVVVGYAPSMFHYNALNSAFRILQKHPTLLALHRGNYFLDKSTTATTTTTTTTTTTANSVVKNHQHHQWSLGPGAFLSCLETSLSPRKCQTHVMGKPSKEFYTHAFVSSDDATTTTLLPLEEICMIGDDILQDIKGAHDAGIGTTILVQTGNYRPNDEHKFATPTTTTTTENQSQQPPQPPPTESSSPEPQPSVPTATCKSIVEAIEYILKRNHQEVLNALSKSM